MRPFCVCSSVKQASSLQLLPPARLPAPLGPESKNWWAEGLGPLKRPASPPALQPLIRWLIGWLHARRPRLEGGMLRTERWQPGRMEWLEDSAARTSER